MRELRYLPRSLLVAVVAVIATLAASVSALVLTRLSPTSRRIEAVIRLWSRAWLWAAGCELEVEGAEHVDAGRSYVIVANHASNLDIMICFLAVPVPIRFLAKKELFRIPLFASAMRAVGIVAVDRQSTAPMHTQINAQAKQLVANGRSLIIYPEGTRARQGELAPFKKGAFTIAVSTGLPVLPVTVLGTRRAWPPGSPLVRGGPVRAIVDPPIETVDMGSGDAAALRDRARGMIAEHILHGVPSSADQS